MVSHAIVTDFFDNANELAMCYTNKKDMVYSLALILGFDSVKF